MDSGYSTPQTFIYLQTVPTLSESCETENWTTDSTRPTGFSVKQAVFCCITAALSGGRAFNDCLECENSFRSSYCFFDRFASKNTMARATPRRIDSIGKPGIFTRPPVAEDREDTMLVNCETTLVCV
jgi:hypothetical protein